MTTVNKWVGRTVEGIGGLLPVALLLFLLPSVGQAQVEALSGEELYIDRLGCWNCHGKSGGGGSGPAIAGTQLSLRTFATYLRLPSGEMPRVSHRLASDADLATLYRWLDGIEAPSTPLPITLSLEQSAATGGAPTEVTLTAQSAGTSLDGDPPDTGTLRYRITLQTMVPWVLEKTPVANQIVEYQLAGREDWSTFTTDDQGQAMLGADQGFVLGDGRAGEPVTARLRTVLPAGRHALVVEALHGTDPDELGLVGIGTVVLMGPDASLVAAQPSAPAAAQQQTAIEPHPATQRPDKLVTHEQMLEWEREMKNWGRWGPDDQRGTLNLITPEKTRAAVSLVREGISVSLYHFPEMAMTIDNGNMRVEPKHWMPGLDPETGEVRGALDAISFAIHDGGNSHIDALCHYVVQSDRENPTVYNGKPQNLNAEGCGSGSIDKMGPGYVTRGILVDIPLLKGVEYLDKRQPIFVEDLEAWEESAGITIGSGDAVFVRTGRWARREAEGPWNYAGETAGLHASVLPWLKERDIAILGGDAVSDVQPSGVEGIWRRPIHDILIPIWGTATIDNGYFKDVAELAARLQRWEFMVSWTMMPVPNGTASPFMGLATF